MCCRSSGKSQERGEIMRNVARSHRWVCWLGILVGVLAGAAGARGADPADWPKVGIGLTGINYYESFPAFTDAIKTVRWINVAKWNDNGYPAAAQNGTIVTARTAISRGEFWPAGRYELSWEGDGEVVVSRPEGQLISEQLDGQVKRRVYELRPDGYGLEIEVPSYPVDNVRLMLPGTADAPTLWHPDYLKALEPFRGRVLRFMDLNRTNSSNQRNWSDRTPHAWSSYANNNQGNCVPWRVQGGASYESMVELCNYLETDMWLCIPHKANEQYVRNLAVLIRTGVDPSTGEKTGQPLRGRVWLEYSNEVWNWNFAQSNYVNDTFADLGDNIDERYARRAVQVYDWFDDAFGDEDRTIRILGSQFGWGGGMRTRQRIEAVDRSRFDAIGITTYTDPDVKQWVYDHPHGTVEEMLDYWEKVVGEGPFTENDPNGNEEAERLYHNYKWAAHYNVPVVAYEGNDHVNPVGKVDTNGDGKKDKRLNEVRPGSTEFIHEAIRHPRMARIYTKWLQRHHESGLVTNMPFVAVSAWSRYGQWGHLEYVGQPVEKAPKFKAILDLYNLTYPQWTNLTVRPQK